MNGSRTRVEKKSQSFWKQTEMNSQQRKPMGHSKGSPEREVHSNTGLPKEDGKVSDKQPDPSSTRTKGITTNKIQSE